MTTPDDQSRRHAEFDTRLTALEAWRTHQSDLLDDLINQQPDLELDDGDVFETVEPLPLQTHDLISWVHDTVTPVIARPLRGEHVWCPRWWEHPEALFRFAALQRAWTELAAEPGIALSLWIRDHLDPCLRELLSPSGPFVDCAHDDRYQHNRHDPLPTLPTETP